MQDYFTLETVRDQFLQIGGAIDSLYTPRGFPPDWQYCPCLIFQACARNNNLKCNFPIYVGIFLNTPNTKMPIVLEIIYERATHRGFVRADNMKLNALIASGIVNGQALTSVTLPF